MTRILLIEDDKAISDIAAYFLQAHGYQVTCARDGNEALACARDPFDLIILDILLPDSNGIDLCQTLRSWYACPIVFSSCLDDTDTIVRALEMGGDDFITKPFDNKVLLARIQANLRRVKMDAEQKPETTDFKFGSFCLNEENHQVTLDGSPIRLSLMEYRILSYFLHHPGIYLTAEEIYTTLWGKDPTGDFRTVQVHIHNLRKKIELDPSNPLYLKSVWGKGYIFKIS